MGFVQPTVPSPNLSQSARSSERLPVGLQILGDAWSEPTLIEIAFGYEQLTIHRVPPPRFPELQN